MMMMMMVMMTFDQLNQWYDDNDLNQTTKMMIEYVDIMEYPNSVSVPNSRTVTAEAVIPSTTVTDNSTVSTDNERHHNVVVTDHQHPTTSPWRYPLMWTIILCIAYSIVFILGLFGNGAVLWVIYTMRHSYNTSSQNSMFASCNNVFNYFICNLALADLLVIIFCLLPNLLGNILTTWILGRFICKAVPYLQGVSVSASIYTLVAISIDRFYGIYYPFNNGFSPLTRKNVILFIWIFSLSITIPWLIYFDLDIQDDSIVMCREIWPEEWIANYYFLIVNCGLQYLLPVSIIIFFYVLLYVEISRRRVPMFQASIRIKSSDSGNITTNNGTSCYRSTDTTSIENLNIRIIEKSKLKVLKMLIIIVSLFVLSWLPIYVIFCIIKFTQIDEYSFNGKLLIGLTPLAQWLGAANSCVNPILYFFFNRKFRAYLRKTIVKNFCCFHPNNNNNSNGGISMGYNNNYDHYYFNSSPRNHLFKNNNTNKINKNHNNHNSINNNLTNCLATTINGNSIQISINNHDHEPTNIINNLNNNNYKDGNQQSQQLEQKELKTFCLKQLQQTKKSNKNNNLVIESNYNLNDNKNFDSNNRCLSPVTNSISLSSSFNDNENCIDEQQLNNNKTIQTIPTTSKSIPIIKHHSKKHRHASPTKSLQAKRMPYTFFNPKFVWNNTSLNINKKNKANNNNNDDNTDQNIDQINKTNNKSRKQQKMISKTPTTMIIVEKKNNNNDNNSNGIQTTTNQVFHCHCSNKHPNHHQQHQLFRKKQITSIVCSNNCFLRKQQNYSTSSSSSSSAASFHSSNSNATNRETQV